MAKRKRLSPAEIKALEPGSEPAPETKSIPGYPLGVQPVVTRRPPIAQVAGDAAAQAALDEVATELRAAKAEGRMVQAIALDMIDVNHLVRDRLVNDPGEMDALKASLAARGQQTPVEVVDLGQGRYGLISGWRRWTALNALHREAKEPRFAKIQALIRQIDTVSDAYIAMVEENEIRADLSFYERARLAAEAVRLKLYPTTNMAVQALFVRASATKRSKIRSFVSVYGGLDDVLRFPAAIPERLGLALAAALQDDRDFGARLGDMLRKTPPQDAAQERRALERALRKTPVHKPVAGEQIAPDLYLSRAKGRATLSGAGLTDAFLADLKAWLATR